MKKLKSILVDLGFKALSNSIFACRSGDLVHTVIAHKDRYGETVISVLVSLPSFIDDPEKLTLENLQSPLCGDVSPRGVISSWSWAKDSLDIELVANVVQGFFAEFSKATDVRKALESLYVSPYFLERLGLDLPLSKSVIELPHARYPISGGAVSMNDASEVVRQHLESTLSSLGFELAKISDVVTVRRRGEMFDAVRVVLDEFGTFVTVVCFPWPVGIWRVDKRWKNNFYPMLPFNVCYDGKPLLLTRQAFVETTAEQLMSILKDSIQQAEGIRDHLEFADHLGPDWSEMAAKLRHIPVSKNLV